MTHKFDKNQKEKLEHPKRREMLPVNNILAELRLTEEERFADIGCGIGYFTIPAAELIRDKGIVYALDIEKEMLEEVNCKRKEKQLENIHTVLTEEYNFMLNDNMASYVFMCTVMHEVKDRIKFLEEAKRILKSGGKIAIIDWIRKETDWGPPADHRVDKNEIKQQLETCGFQNITSRELNNYFYLIQGSNR